MIGSSYRAITFDGSSKSNKIAPKLYGGRTTENSIQQLK